MRFAAIALLAATLPTGWRIQPAGRQIPLDTFPFRAHLLSQDPPRVLVLHAGYRPPSLAIVNLASGSIEKSLALPEAGHGFVIRGNEVYVAGGHSAKVFRTTLDLEPVRKFALRDGYLEDVALSADGKELFAAEQARSSIAVWNLENGELARSLTGVARPSRLLFDGNRLLAASPGEDKVLALNPLTGEVLHTAAVASHPADLLVHGGSLYVASAGSSYLDILDRQTLQPKLRLNLALHPKAPFHMTLSHLALHEPSQRLYVACSDANAVAVIDLAGRQPALAGYIPAGWYPTASLPLGDSSLLILNGKGNGSQPNPSGPNPTLHSSMTPRPPSVIQYIPLMQNGSISLVEGLSASALRTHTGKVLQLVPQPAPPKATLRTPPAAIRHVILIMKENRTYDQILGDLPQGNGDPSLCLFPERISPNHHKLAREFTLFDNFYVNADVSAEGWLWTSAAIVPHFNMRHWPASYAGRAKAQGTPDADPLFTPSTRYLWTQALKKGLSFRNYGFFVVNRKGAGPGDPILASTSDPELLPHTNRYYAGYDPGFPDVERARVFLEDLKQFEAAGSMPRLITMVLPNDHTFGTAPGKLTPYSSVADNDLALGRIIEGLSRSRFWPHLAVFVVEDDAQNGPDHVDSHRAPAFVLSPYIRRGFVDSTFYNTTSVLRAIEMILGLPPMTHYDATATPILAAFQSKPDLRPYTAVPNGVSLTELNPLRSATAHLNENLDFSEPDRIDDAALNRILWLALRSAEPPPATFIPAASFGRMAAP